MKRTLLTTTTVLFLAVILSLTPAVAAQATDDANPANPSGAGDAPPPTAPAESVWAFRSLHIPDMPPDDIFREMVRSASREHAAMLGLPPDDAANLITFQPHDGGGLFGNRGGDSADRLGVSVNLQNLPAANPKPRAADFLDSVLATVNESLTEWHAERVGLERAARAVREAEVAVSERRANLREREQMIRHVTGRADASADAIRASLPKLDEERQALKLQVAGKGARQKAIAETIERLAKAAEQRVQQDAIAVELEKIIDAREVVVRRVEKLIKDKVASTTELAEPQAALAEARARLLERREAVAQTNGGELLATLNAELASLSIDAAEAQAKLAAMDALLAKYVEVQEPLAEADDVRSQLRKAHEALDLARQHESEVRGSIPENVFRVIESKSETPEQARRQMEADREEADRRANDAENQRGEQ